MQIESHSRLRANQPVAADRVVIRDQFQNPLFVAIQLDNGTVMMEMASPDNMGPFRQLLRQAGVTDTVIVNDLKV